MILIGMPGIEKRIARFPQFYSRIGFVHEFRPLDATEMQYLLERRWTPVGVTLPDEPLTPEVMARLIRMMVMHPWRGTTIVTPGDFLARSQEKSEPAQRS